VQGPPSSPRPKRRIRQGVFILPSALTIGSVFCAFYAIVQAYRGRFETAGTFIIVAAILDTLDGRIARLTRTATDFGRELDSLADAISFGLAPALTIYFFALKDLNRAGWLLAFLYITCGIIRLARFNVLAIAGHRKHFVGLPIPAAASFFALLLLLDTPPDSVLFPIGALVMAYLMVSTIPYPAFKDLELKTMRPTFTLLAIVLLFLVVAFHPAISLFVLLCVYLLAGPVLLLLDRRDRRKNFSEYQDEL
jgi:CDP-diacylglycerol--serine O-phosphatidyltransferase